MSPLLLHRPSSSLFFSSNNPDDPRLGDITGRPDEVPTDDPVGAIPDEVRAVLLGVPQDEGVRRNGGRVGAAAGPEAIRRRFYRLAAYDVERNREIPSRFLWDLGDIDCGGELEEVHRRLSDLVDEIIAAGRVPIVLGGGHDITYGALDGAHAACGELGFFNFDAHLDVRPPLPQRNSGTSFRMLIDEGKVDTSRAVQFGIQPFANARAHVEWFTGAGGTISTLEGIRHVGTEAALSEALRIAGRDSTRYYGTLDLDGVRGAEAPGVSAPMPDGFAGADLLAAARALGEDPCCVALDIAEMNPTYDRDELTARLAATAIAGFLGGMLERNHG